MRTLPFDKAKLEEIAAKWPTPFHIYDAKAIRENAKRQIGRASCRERVSVVV